MSNDEVTNGFLCALQTNYDHRKVNILRIEIQGRIVY